MSPPGPEPCLPPTPDELAAALPRLLDTSGGALGWWRVRHTPLAAAEAGATLHDVYRQHAAQAALHAVERARVLDALGAGGLRPIVVKGWAIARCYPEPGLRPYGDLDVCVDPGDAARARDAVSALGLQAHAVDVHEGLPALDRPFTDVRTSARTVDDGNRLVTIPSAAHHLRYLCLHFLGHGAWRPLWLCDVAVAVENDPPGWDELLAGDARRTDWIAATLRLAEVLLGADLAAAPPRVRDRTLPSWLVRSVTATWSAPFVSHGNRAPLATVPRRHPLRLARALRLRWPTPVEATVGMGAAFDERPRLPIQLAFVLRRLARRR